MHIRAKNRPIIRKPLSQSHLRRRISPEATRLKGVKTTPRSSVSRSQDRTYEKRRIDCAWRARGMGAGNNRQPFARVRGPKLPCVSRVARVSTGRGGSDRIGPARVRTARHLYGGPRAARPIRRHVARGGCVARGVAGRRVVGGRRGGAAAQTTAARHGTVRGCRRRAVVGSGKGRLGGRSRITGPRDSVVRRSRVGGWTTRTVRALAIGRTRRTASGRAGQTARYRRTRWRQRIAPCTGAELPGRSRWPHRVDRCPDRAVASAGRCLPTCGGTGRSAVE